MMTGNSSSNIKLLEATNGQSFMLTTQSVNKCHTKLFLKKEENQLTEGKTGNLK